MTTHTSLERADRLRAELRAWVEGGRRLGYTMPEDEAVELIAVHGGIPSSIVFQTGVAAWMPTITWLIAQVDRGDAEPHRHIPIELASPRVSAPTGSVAPGGDVAAAGLGARPDAYAALARWRDEARARGEEGADRLSDTHLRSVANSRLTSAEEIRRSFPPAVSHFADELAGVLAGVEGGAEDAAGSVDGRPGAGQDASAGVPAVSASVSSSLASAPSAPVYASSSALGGLPSFGSGTTQDAGRRARLGEQAGELADRVSPLIDAVARSMSSATSRLVGRPAAGGPGVPGADGAPGADSTPPAATAPDDGSANPFGGPGPFGEQGAALAGARLDDASTRPTTLPVGVPAPAYAQPGGPAENAPSQALPAGSVEAPASAEAPAHASAPPSAPAAPQPAPARQAGPVDPEGFAPYDFGAPVAPEETIRVSPGPGGTVRLTWDARPEPGVYRVVSSDDHAPYSPDLARVVAATTDVTAIDEEPYRSAVRHYQVWWNPGETLDEARAAQPVAYAQGASVGRVLGLELKEDEGRVIGQWTVLPGTKRVQIFRVPAREAAQFRGDPRYRIAADSPNMFGFVDTNPTRGEQYLYQVLAEADVDGVTRLSAAESRQLQISTIHEPIRDLSFTLHDGEEGPLFDLEWSVPPGGRVVVHRTSHAPDAGIERQIQHVGVLEQAGLGPDTVLRHPIEASGDGRARMRSVPWPREWTRAYFTAVVVQGEDAFVGNTVHGVRVPPVGRPRITERVNHQVLTFEWPEGADVVLAFRSAVGVPSDIVMADTPLEITRHDYEERGGLTFAYNELDPVGCDVHVVPAAYDAGRRVHGSPAVVTYQGVLRMGYRVGLVAGPDGGPAIEVALTSERRMGAPAFVLVHHPTRLPMSASDGTPVPLVVATRATTSQALPRVTPGEVRDVESPDATFLSPSGAWQPILSRGNGFVRLFADLPAEHLKRFAVFDPHIRTLHVSAFADGMRHG